MKYRRANEIGAVCGRPPRGGRGLKCQKKLLKAAFVGVAPLAGGVD